MQDAAGGRAQGLLAPQTQAELAVWVVGQPCGMQALLWPLPVGDERPTAMLQPLPQSNLVCGSWGRGVGGLAA